MIYGYARVSSNGQDLAQQLAQLDAAGCTKVYREKVSAATAERPQLKRAIGALDAGDVLMVTVNRRPNGTPYQRAKGTPCQDGGTLM